MYTCISISKSEHQLKLCPFKTITIIVEIYIYIYFNLNIIGIQKIYYN